MKLAFVGDSFCACTGPGTPHGSQRETHKSKDRPMMVESDNDWWPNHEYDWPWLVVQKMKGTIICSGIQGVNFYHSFQDFLGRVDEADYIVFCVTEPWRIINKHQLPMNKGWLEQITDNTEAGEMYLDYCASDPRYKGLGREEILKMVANVRYYYDSIMDHGAAEIMQQGFLMYVDKMMVEKNKQCIWLNSFPGSNKDIPDWSTAFTPKSGPVGNLSLYSISEGPDLRDLRDEEWPETTSEWDGATGLWEWLVEVVPINNKPLVGLDRRRNHLSKAQNIAMSKFILDAIKYDSLDPGILDMKKYFKVDEEVENVKDPFIYP